VAVCFLALALSIFFFALFLWRKEKGIKTIMFYPCLIFGKRLSFVSSF